MADFVMDVGFGIEHGALALAGWLDCIVAPLQKHVVRLTDVWVLLIQFVFRWKTLLKCHRI